MCGKNAHFQGGNVSGMGSPPRVREKRLNRLSPSLTKRDHPRVCGKNKATLVALISAVGSPPRVREKLNQWVKAYQDFGITPACAGKTSDKTQLFNLG